MLVLSSDGAETQRLHPGVTTVDRWNWRAVASALRGTDLFVLGGGSLLQDATSVQSVVWYGLMALLARRRSRRMLWWGQGIGPLNAPISRRIVRWIARQADAVTVRDDDSAKLLKVIGVSGSIYTVADPAFALEPASSAATSSPRLLLALRPWRDDAIGKALAGGSGGGIRGDRGGIEALPMHLPGDAAYMQSLPSAGISTVHDWRVAGWTPEQALGLVSRSEMVVAMRLHALIFAARTGVPFVALSYDPKVDALAVAAGHRDALLPVDGVTAPILAETIARVRDTAAVRRETLLAFGEAQGLRARIPAGIAHDLLEI
jgi:polysaccharide pyruvyl transferase CsaB